VKVFILDVEAGMGLDLAYRAHHAEHEVCYWNLNPLIGKGMIDTTRDWKEAVEWAELTICTGNADYPEGFEEYFTKGYPIFGTNPAAAELELDRGKGQEALKKAGVPTIPYVVVDSINQAAAYLISTKCPCVIKPWGGEGDKSLTHVCKSVDDGLFTLQRWKEQGVDAGQLMLQRKIEGVEVGVSGFFGSSGWCKWIEESFEHKKFLTGDLGENTGEMGTVIQHTEDSALFREVLEPLTDLLHLLRFVGDCSVNCIVKDGVPYPLEFTMRLGWPDFTIRQAVLRGDPVKWMAELIYGRDIYEVLPHVAIGVVMTNGDSPKEKDDPKVWSGFPLYGVTAENEKHFHWQQVKRGSSPRFLRGEKKDMPGIVTAGVYPLVVTGTGTTVRRAKRAVYENLKEVTWPSNVMYRIDIGDRLEDDLSLLHDQGYCQDVEF
jgi:phosphoribosylamine---glycine ligase